MYLGDLLSYATQAVVHPTKPQHLAALDLKISHSRTTILLLAASYFPWQTSLSLDLKA